MTKSYAVSKYYGCVCDCTLFSTIICTLYFLAPLLWDEKVDKCMSCNRFFTKSYNSYSFVNISFMILLDFSFQDTFILLLFLSPETKIKVELRIHHKEKVLLKNKNLLCMPQIILSADLASLPPSV